MLSANNKYTLWLCKRGSRFRPACACSDFNVHFSASTLFGHSLGAIHATLTRSSGVCGAKHIHLFLFVGCVCCECLRPSATEFMSVCVHLNLIKHTCSIHTQAHARSLRVRRATITPAHTHKSSAHPRCYRTLLYNQVTVERANPGALKWKALCDCPAAADTSRPLISRPVHTRAHNLSHIHAHTLCAMMYYYDAPSALACSRSRICALFSEPQPNPPNPPQSMLVLLCIHARVYVNAC